MSSPSSSSDNTSQPDSPKRTSLFTSLTRLQSGAPSYAQAAVFTRAAQALPSLWRDLDRIQVLGDDTRSGYGHKGCVNALSWSSDGETLISSGDDCRLCIWEPRTGTTLIHPDDNDDDDSMGLNSEYFTSSLTLRTGHTNNVFNTQFLPHTNDMKIVSCSADKQVRVFDLARASSADRTVRVDGRAWEERPESQCCVRTFRCHTGRVKKIVTEDSPDRFLTVSEDHTVRQHDLRTAHRCKADGCPAPLIRLPYSINAIACSPITPFYFTVAGHSAFGHLFDRRMVGRILQHEWGQEIDENTDGTSRCVRRFGRLQRGPRESKRDPHVSGARMAKSNGRELLLSFMNDGAYLYDIHDQPYEDKPREVSIVPPNETSPQVTHETLTAPITPGRKRRKREDGTSIPALIPEEWEGVQNANPAVEPSEPSPDTSTAAVAIAATAPVEWSGIDSDMPEGLTGTEELRSLLADVEMALDDDNDDDYDPDQDDDGVNDSEEEETDNYVTEQRTGPGWDPLNRPIVMPRARFAGMANVRTVKDVNFLGPNDDYVASGSDDGNFFIWSKKTAKLIGIWEGDGSVVNVIEDRPTGYPLLAVSGIDDTVKLFAPTPEPRKFSRIRSAADIMKNSMRITREYESAIDITFLAAHLRSQGGGECVLM